MAPSLSVQPAGAASAACFAPKVLKASRLVPSKRTIQPAAFSAAVSGVDPGRPASVIV